LDICKHIYALYPLSLLTSLNRVAALGERKVFSLMETMEYGAAAGNVAATELVQQPSSDSYPMMPPASVPPPSEQLFCRLANFEIEKKIGRGQFSTVFRARCQTNGTIVALKKVQVKLHNLFIFYALTKLDIREFRSLSILATCRHSARRVLLVTLVWTECSTCCLYWHI